MKDVFEPMANFGGEVFEPMNFDGDYSNFYKDEAESGNKVDANTVIAGATAVAGLFGSLAEAKAKRKDADAKLAELRGKRGNALKDCETAKENLFWSDPKKQRNRIRDCKTLVDRRFDKEEAEQNEIVNKQLEIEGGKISLQKSSLQTASSDKEADKKAKSRRNLILGASIVGGVLVLGTILFFVLRKK